MNPVNLALRSRGRRRHVGDRRGSARARRPRVPDRLPRGPSRPCGRRRARGRRGHLARRRWPSTGGPHRFCGPCSSADLVVSAGIGTLAWKALTTPEISVKGRHLISPDGAEGVALGDLDPDGIVRVNGENWSAVALNGTVKAGSPVQVLRIAGVRLEVWGDDRPRPTGRPQRARHLIATTRWGHRGHGVAGGRIDKRRRPLMIIGIIVGVVVLLLLIMCGLSVRIVREYQRIVLVPPGPGHRDPRARARPDQPGHRPHDLGRPARAVPRDPPPDGDHQGQRVDLDRLHHLLQGGRPLDVGAARRQLRGGGPERRRDDASQRGRRHAPRRRACPSART